VSECQISIDYAPASQALILGL